jgi:Concanavalin A-like lectin/glucanases superfamily
VAADPTVEDHMDGLCDPDRLLSGVSASSLEKLDVQQIRLNSACCAGPKSTLRNLSSHSILRGLEKKGDREPTPEKDKPLPGFSPSNRSKVATIRELLPFLVSFIQQRIVITQQCYEKHGREKEIEKENERDKDSLEEDFGSSNSGISYDTSQPYLTSDFIWLIKQMRTLSVLLEMTRLTIQKYLQAGEGTVDSLFPAEICDRLQHTLMLHADHMMKTQRNVFYDLLQSPDSFLPKSNLDNRRCIKKDTDNNGRDTNRDRNRDRESCVEENEYSMSSLLSPQPRKELTAWELIQKVQGGDFVSLDVTDNTDSVMNASVLPENGVEKKLVRSSMGQLRKELVLNYFSADCNAQGGPRIIGIEEKNPPFFNAFGSCLSDHFDTLFYTDSLKSEFLVLLGGLLSKDTVDSKVVESSRVKETEQYCRSLRLFIQILLKYRRMKEVLLVVLKPRRIYGLTVFKQLLTVYSHLSMLSLQSENQVQDPRPKGIRIPSRELCRALNVLEQCNSNFVKCVIPLIFAPSSSHSTCSVNARTSPVPPPIPRPLKSDSSGENTKAVEDDLMRDTIRIEKDQADEEAMWTLLGRSIIQGIFHSAECVLDLLANEPSEDSINTQRHGAVITSVLPTVLVYGIANSRACGCVQDLLPLTRSLTRSIQSYISGKESDNQSVYKAGNGLGLGLGMGNNGVQNLVRTGTAASSSTVAPCVDSKEGSPSCPGTASTSEKISSKCFTYVEEKEGSTSSSNTVLMSVKRTPADRDKDLSHLTWWSRLLRLAYSLNAKLAASLLYDPTIHVKDPQHCVSAPKDCYPLCYPLSRHQIWSILTPPEDLIAFMNISASARPSITTGGNTSQKPVSGRTRQPMPLTPNSKDSATNSLYIKLLNKCVIMRDRESASDLLYRSIQTALKTSVNMRVLVQGIEHSLFEAVVFVEGTGVLDPPNPVSGVLCGSSNQTQTLVQTHARIDRCSKAWTAIARLTKRIMSQRSVLVSESSTLTWLDTLTIILRQTNAVKEVIFACNSSIIISPIGMSARVRKFPALRRVILVVVCMLRWNAAVRLNLKSSGCITVGFITSVLESMTQGLTNIPSPELMSSRWKTLLSGLRAGSTDVSDFSKGLMVATEIVQETPFSSVKCDIINSLTAAWRNRFFAESNMSVLRDGTKVAALCCTESAWQMRKEAGRALESYLCSVVRDLTLAYLSSSIMSPAEIHYFSLVLSILQLLFVCGDENGALEGYNKKNCMGDPRNFKDVCHTRLLTASKTEILKHLEKVFIAIDVRTMQPSAQMLEDRASSASRAWGSSRDRSKALKKVSNAIVSLYLAFSCREGSARENSAMCNHVMSSHNELLAHLQKVRQSAQQQVADSELQSAVRNSSISKPTETLDPHSTSTTSAVPATKISAHAIKEGSKRRCQELIVRPLEFCRAQEGFVVQGDSLLSNFKGIDFTLATWLYVDKKCPAGHSFITGRVSHHDAWPLMLLRNDNKLDVIYGHNNNFECMASIAVIPLYTWTHVAVVIEQKKIKLFVNGVMDCQVNTKGNARAIVYPIVVGLCPTGLRTHVEHTRVGFDGLLAQYKYYTRALSPIHVRVVFDQGQSTLLYLQLVCVCVVMRFLNH